MISPGCPDFDIPRSSYLGLMADEGECIQVAVRVRCYSQRCALQPLSACLFRNTNPRICICIFFSAISLKNISAITQRLPNPIALKCLFPSQTPTWRHIQWGKINHSYTQWGDVFFCIPKVYPSKSVLRWNCGFFQKKLLRETQKTCWIKGFFPKDIQNFHIWIFGLFFLLQNSRQLLMLKLRFSLNYFFPPVSIILD